ncbi:MAG: carboxypeptidase-like regulatory domain-containing protein [Gemmatimonadota bacterium]
MLRRLVRLATVVVVGVASTLLGMTPELSAQEVRGTVTDASNGASVGLAAVILLDGERNAVRTSIADVEGRYVLPVPGQGEYYLIAERLGYFESESPLLAIGGEGVFGADFELRPEPIRLDPLEVTVTNEQLTDFLTMQLGMGENPSAFIGYRAMQGERIARAQIEADDTSDFLRRLYVPISHGQEVCIGSFGRGTGLPARMGYERVMEAQARPDPTSTCGTLYINGFRCPNDQIEALDRYRVAAVVVLPGEVHMFTRDFDWSLKPGGANGACV